MPVCPQCSHSQLCCVLQPLASSERGRYHLCFNDPCSELSKSVAAKAHVGMLQARGSGVWKLSLKSHCMLQRRTGVTRVAVVLGMLNAVTPECSDEWCSVGFLLLQASPAVRQARREGAAEMSAGRLGA